MKCPDCPHQADTAPGRIRCLACLDAALQACTAERPSWSSGNGVVDPRRFCARGGKLKRPKSERQRWSA